jgi:hypothetical protein
MKRRHDILHGGTIPTFSGGAEEIHGNPTTVTHQPRSELNVKDDS